MAKLAKQVYLIIRQIAEPNSGKILQCIPVEYCQSEAEARKYSKLFDMQTPSDLRDKISHTYHYADLL